MAPVINVYKLCDAELWVEAQRKFHHGKCDGIFHKLLYSSFWKHSEEKPDGSSAGLVLCGKCHGVRESYITIRIL